MMGARSLTRYVLQDLTWPMDLLKSNRIVKLSPKAYWRFKAKLNITPRPLAMQLVRGGGVSSIVLSNFVKVIVSTFSGYLVIKNFLTSSFCVEAATLSMEKVIEEADMLYDKLHFEEIYRLLWTYKDAKNADILWRLSRAIFEKAKVEEKVAEKKVLYGEALKLLNIAESLDKNNFAVHKWLAIIMDSYYTLDGIKSRISHLYDMKTHMEELRMCVILIVYSRNYIPCTGDLGSVFFRSFGRVDVYSAWSFLGLNLKVRQKACELKPNDGTSLYVLGMWYFGIANISWYEKKAASLFFATPPEATYDEALKFFMEAEKVEPDFYSKNYLMIGKCLYYLGRKDESKVYLLKAKDYLQKTEDDKEAVAEAETWLKSL